MKLPGFRAEQSLHKSGNPYAVTRAVSAPGPGVIPAAPCCSACDWACSADPPLPWCYTCLRYCNRWC